MKKLLTISTLVVLLIVMASSPATAATASFIIPVEDDYHATMKWNWYYESPGFTLNEYVKNDTYTEVSSVYRFRDYPPENRYFGETTRGYLMFMLPVFENPELIASVTLNVMPVARDTDGAEIWHVSEELPGESTVPNQEHFERVDKDATMIGTIDSPVEWAWTSIDLLANGTWDYVSEFSEDDQILYLGIKNKNEFSDPRTFTGSITGGLWEEDKFSIASLERPGDSEAYLEITIVPIPGAIWLLSSGLIGLLGFRKKFRE